MSRARTLIGSGGSTFSLWAAYLGQLPTVFPPGHPPSWYKLENASGRFLGTFDPQRPDEGFLRDVDSAFGRAAAQGNGEGDGTRHGHSSG
jgi:hypothetical protein